MSTTITNINIHDPIASHAKHAIEVSLTLSDGSQRWCFFVTAEGIPNYGDFLDDMKDVRIHYGAAHMIVISEISEEIIHKTLTHIHKNGELELATLKLEDTK